MWSFFRDFFRIIKNYYYDRKQIEFLDEIEDDGPDIIEV